MKSKFFMDDKIERRKWQNPEAILKEIKLLENQIFLDIGCGTGYFAIPAARIVGRKGKVYGIDASEKAINILKEEAGKEGLNNLTLSAGKAEETIFPNIYADILFFGIVLHDFQDPLKVLQNGRKMLKPNGRLINIDWKKESMKYGPPLKIRYDQNQAKNLIKEAGFRIKKIEDIGDYHYLIEAAII